MEFNEYQSAARRTAKYPNIGSNICYPTLGLAGETGEVAEKIKKIIRDNGGVVDDERREALKKELGDVLWYIASLCSELGLSMDDVAAHNIHKLSDRWNRNAIHGSGDNR